MMNENGKEYRKKPADINIEDEDLSASGGRHLPKVLDPVVTMGVVQKYLDTERKNSRRVLFWMSAVFLFAVLCILVLFVSVGMFLYQNARKAVGIAEDTKAQTAFYATEVIGMSNKLSSLEQQDSQLRNLMKTAESTRSEESKVLKTDLQRFSRWVESLNARDMKALSELETRVREMQQVIALRDKQLDDLKKQYASVSAPGPLAARQPQVEPIVVADNTQASEPGKAEVPEIDSGSVSTVGVFDAVLSIKETNALARVQPQGEISVVNFPGGDRYEGEFRGGLLNGKGTYYYRNGDKYEGEFRNDMKEGFGVYYHANGDRYSGEFKNDMKEGKGSLMFHNSEKYVGDFKNDAITGKGTMIYLNGNKYAGGFKNGLKDGSGILSFHNGDIYKGDFKDDLRNGKGSYMFLDGAKFVGEFVNDKRHGQGRYVYPGGEEYVGNFKNGKKDGEGTCIYPNGRKLKGVWRNDKLVEELREQ
jgi:hypothetical protein